MLREIVLGGVTVSPMAPCLIGAGGLAWLSYRLIPTKIIELLSLDKAWLSLALFSAYLFIAVSVLKG